MEDRSRKRENGSGEAWCESDGPACGSAMCSWNAACGWNAAKWEMAGPCMRTGERRGRGKGGRGWDELWVLARLRVYIYGRHWGTGR